MRWQRHDLSGELNLSFEAFRTSFQHKTPCGNWPTARSRHTLEIARSDWPTQWSSRETYAALEQVTAEQGARYVRPRNVLCPNGRCPTLVDGRMLYRDTGHITEFAARWMAARMNLLGEAGQISRPEI